MQKHDRQASLKLGFVLWGFTAVWVLFLSVGSQ